MQKYLIKAAVLPETSPYPLPVDQCQLKNSSNLGCKSRLERTTEEDHGGLLDYWSAMRRGHR